MASVDPGPTSSILTLEPPPGRPAGRRAAAAAGVEAARDRLFELQNADGHWCAELEGDSILESEYALLLWFLGRGDDPRVQSAAAYLRNKQLAEGGWALYPGGPPDVSGSVKAYFALKLAGDSPAAPHMERAREAIRARGGLDACNSFTKLYLAIFGQYEWRLAPAVPPELMLFPNWFPFNIYEMSSWSRAIVVPLSIIWSCKPSCEVPAAAGLEELRVPGAAGTPAPASVEHRFWAGLFRVVDRTNKLLERLRVQPLRRRALERAERWVLERLELSDGLGAIFPPIVNTVMALRGLGYPADHPVIAGQLRELEKLEIPEGGTLRLQPCKSPVWDTVLALTALAEGERPRDRPALERAVRWLLDHEVRQPGDWRIKNPDGPVGGWYFEYANEFYPDCDDTAQALVALGKLSFAPADPEVEATARRALAWLLSMQNDDGGWASFDRGCDKRRLTYIPFADHNAMIDPSTTDITSRALECLELWGYPAEHPAVRRGLEFVRRKQLADGSWYGRWGVNYLYGTWLALWGLARWGAGSDDPAVARGADWIRGCQNADGGWGESPRSYDEPETRGQGPSTAAQTAWAVLGLLAAGDRGSAALERGVDYLLSTQEAGGGWTDEPWTGTGFPRVFYLRYHLYATYFPLLALAAYERGTAGVPDDGTNR